MKICPASEKDIQNMCMRHDANLSGTLDMSGEIRVFRLKWKMRVSYLAVSSTSTFSQ